MSATSTNVCFKPKNRPVNVAKFASRIQLVTAASAEVRCGSFYEVDSSKTIDPAQQVAKEETPLPAPTKLLSPKPVRLIPLLRAKSTVEKARPSTTSAPASAPSAVVYSKQGSRMIVDEIDQMEMDGTLPPLNFGGRRI